MEAAEDNNPILGVKHFQPPPPKSPDWSEVPQKPDRKAVETTEAVSADTRGLMMVEVQTRRVVAQHSLANTYACLNREEASGFAGQTFDLMGQTHLFKQEETRSKGDGAQNKNAAQLMKGHANRAELIFKEPLQLLELMGQAQLGLGEFSESTHQVLKLKGQAKKEENAPHEPMLRMRRIWSKERKSYQLQLSRVCTIKRPSKQHILYLTPGNSDGERIEDGQDAYARIIRDAYAAKVEQKRGVLKLIILAQIDGTTALEVEVRREGTEMGAATQIRTNNCARKDGGGARMDFSKYGALKYQRILLGTGYKEGWEISSRYSPQSKFKQNKCVSHTITNLQYGSHFPAPITVAGCTESGWYLTFPVSYYDGSVLKKDEFCTSRAIPFTSERVGINLPKYGLESFSLNKMTEVEDYSGWKKIDPPHKKLELPPMLCFLLMEGVAQNNGRIYLPGQWLNEFPNDGQQQRTIDDQWINEFSRVNIINGAREWGQQVVETGSWEKSSHNWAQRGDEYLNEQVAISTMLMALVRFSWRQRPCRDYTL